MIEGNRLSTLEYGLESVGLQGETASGDRHVVKEISTGVMIGVIDGLGHGVEAAAAAKLAAETIEAHAEEAITSIAKACDEKLKMTRGAAMALASVNSDENTVTWFSIGSIDGIHIRMDPATNPGFENIFMHPGVVGYRLQLPFASVFTIAKNDLLIFSTDGIRNDYSEKVASDARYAENVLNRLKNSQAKDLSNGGSNEKPSGLAHGHAASMDLASSLAAEGKDNFSPQNLASYIYRNYAKGSDDALVLVAKYLGKAG